MSMVRAGRDWLVIRKSSFIADQRGAVAFELPFVYVFVILVVFLPLADVAIAGFQYISAWEALRAFGQSILYSPPSDPTNVSTWSTSARAKADPKYPISVIQVLCGDSNTSCTSATATLTPKYYSYSTTVTLSPMVLRSVLCTSTSGGDPCTYTLPYSERFQ